MPYLVENWTRVDFTEDEAETLLKMGFVVEVEGATDVYEPASLLWDFNLGAEAQVALFEHILQGLRS